MNPELWLKQIAEEQAATNGEESLWWLSFVDPAKAAPQGEQVPGGPGFLGVVIVEDAGPLSAVTRASVLGLNPGGEVKMYGPFPRDTWPKEVWYKLMTAEQVNALGEHDDSG